MIVSMQRGDNLLTGQIQWLDKVAYVVCCNDIGDPLLVIEHLGRDVVRMTRADEHDFPQVLRRLGYPDQHPLPKTGPLP